MSAYDAIVFAETFGGGDKIPILIGGMHAVVGRKSAERADSLGIEFSYLYLQDDKVVSVPNLTSGRE
jgi:hypothetical protein